MTNIKSSSYIFNVWVKMSWTVSYKDITVTTSMALLVLAPMASLRSALFPHSSFSYMMYVSVFFKLLLFPLNFRCLILWIIHCPLWATSMTCQTFWITGGSLLNLGILGLYMCLKPASHSRFFPTKSVTRFFSLPSCRGQVPQLLKTLTLILRNKFSKLAPF